MLFRERAKNAGDVGSCFMGCQSILVRLSTFSGKYGHISAIAEEIESKNWD